MGMYTEEPMFEDPNLPDGWYRKVVQRQTGATAGLWDVYIYNPEGKKFRSRNELRAYLGQTGSDLSADDFDFSVKGKGHQNKGKTPSKEASTPTVATPSNRLGRNRKSLERTPVATPPPKKPKRVSLSKQKTPRSVARKRSVTSENKNEVEEPQNDEEENEDEADDKDVEVANVKLKVKVGYTSAGAMIRPATGGRKKKKRFRNLDKKSPPKKSTSPTPALDSKDKVATSHMKEEAGTPLLKKKDRVAPKRKRKTIEPVPGPSGLQKVKRSPRRVLRRHGHSESEDDEDYEYMCSLYPNTSEEGDVKESRSSDAGQDSTSQPVVSAAGGAAEQEEPAIQNEEGKPSTNGQLAEETTENEGLDEDTEHESEQTGVNGILNDEVPADGVGPMLTVDEVEQETENELELADGDMQVVVIGDSLKDIHNYAKPPTLA